MIVGADLALNHGALVNQAGRVLYTYTDGIGLGSSVEHLYRRAEEVAERTPPDCTVVIDWDRTMAGWNDDVTVGTLITMLLGFYGALCRMKGCRVHYLAPATLRTLLGLSESLSKSAVHREMADVIPRQLYRDEHGDCVDAWLLAYAFDTKLSKMTNGAYR